MVAVSMEKVPHQYQHKLIPEYKEGSFKTTISNGLFEFHLEHLYIPFVPENGYKNHACFKFLKEKK